MIKAIFFKTLFRKIIFFSFLSITAALSTLLLDLSSYQQLSQQQDLFEVSINKIKNQQFELILEKKTSGVKHRYVLEGDQWQLDYRLIRLTASAFLLSSNHFFKFTRLSNRYSSSEDQLSQRQIIFELEELAVYQPDLWSFLYSNQRYLPFIDTVFGGSVFVPLEDGAIYTIRTGFAGITVKALNDQANTAIINWQ